LGFARFSYALILPSMRADLTLSYGSAGLLGTANTAGYLAGCVALPRILRNRSVLGVFRIGVFITMFGVVSTGFTKNYILILGSRTLAGIGGAAAFILGSALAASIASKVSNSVVIFNAGAGLGIVIGAAVLPPLLQSHPDRWQSAWFVLGAFAVVAGTAAMTRKLEGPKLSTSLPSFANAVSGEPSLRWLTASYICFGTGYIVFVTFLVSTLRSRGSSATFTSAAFVVLGVMATLSPWLWRRPLASWPTRRLMSSSLIGQGLAAILLVASRQPVTVIVSVGVFGAMFLMTPAVVTITVRQERPEQEWTSTIGAITALFAVGQAIAPWLSGVLIDHLGSKAGLWWTAGFSMLGAWLATQWKPKHAA
jgi:predicted MFS family arabinose efflux permease